MRKWSGDIDKASEEYKGLVDDLYKNVDVLVSSEFTGGLSKEFENDVLDKKDTFLSLSTTLNEASELISATASSIDDDEEYLASRFKSNNEF
jgi:uncharacterized protein YukE